jgi:hypothetical protein
MEGTTVAEPARKHNVLKATSIKVRPDAPLVLFFKPRRVLKPQGDQLQMFKCGSNQYLSQPAQHTAVFAIASCLSVVERLSYDSRKGSSLPGDSAEGF